MVVFSQNDEDKLRRAYPDRFPISPLIRITLLGLYATLMAPLPVLAKVTAASLSSWLLWAGIIAGAIGLYAALAQSVQIDEEGIRVIYPRWSRWLFRSGWQLKWADIVALKSRSTGQGGIVYYFIGRDQQAYLLPMRVAGFARLVQHVEAKTNIDTRDVKPLAQPWMYGILLGFTLILFLIDVWTILAAAAMGASNGL